MSNEIELDLDALVAAAEAALQKPVSTPFLKKTNSECAEWMRSFYSADAIPSIERHCTWAWQEQERRNSAVVLELVRRLRAAEALVAARLTEISADAAVIGVIGDFKPEQVEACRAFHDAIRAQVNPLALVICLQSDYDIKALDEDAMRAAGWMRIDRGGA